MMFKVDLKTSRLRIVEPKGKHVNNQIPIDCPLITQYKALRKTLCHGSAHRREKQEEQEAKIILKHTANSRPA